MECATIPMESKRTLLKVVPIVLRVGKLEFKTNALLDSGSTIRLLRTDIAKKLGATGPTSPVCIQLGDGSESQQRNTQTVYIIVEGNYHGAKSLMVLKQFRIYQSIRKVSTGSRCNNSGHTSKEFRLPITLMPNLEFSSG